MSSMTILGYSPGLQIEDLDWLLADGPSRGPESERRLSVDAAVRIWRKAGSPAALLARIQEVARVDGVMMQACESCTQPRPRSTQEIDLERELKDVQNRAATQQLAKDKYWKDFLGGLRSNPQRAPPTPTDECGRTGCPTLHAVAFTEAQVSN